MIQVVSAYQTICLFGCVELTTVASPSRDLQHFYQVQHLCRIGCFMLVGSRRGNMFRKKIMHS